MLSEYLVSHPLKETLVRGPIRFFPPAEDREAWQALSPAHRQEIRALAEKYAPLPYPLRKATDFLAFVRTGSRRADEDPYFFRRRKLCAAALQCCLDEKASLDDVIDGVWCVCEESSWVISAHNVNPIPGAPAARDYPLPDPDKPYIDLFAAQTGMILSLVRHMLGKRLDAVSGEITRRVDKEIRTRLLAPFMKTDDFWWMGVKRRDLNNWTPWILSNLMLCACQADEWSREQKALFLERACGMLDRWLACLPRDGGCDEGVAYWNMAGGAMLDCLELLEKVTDGKMAFWQDEKIRNILSFPQKAEIGGGWFVNFADCDARPFLSGERLQLAGERMNAPSLTAMGACLRGTLADQLNDVPHFTRLLDLLFHAPADTAALEAPGDVWLPGLQLRVVRRDGLTLCCKGGHNGESHNHNDVGSFMLYIDGEPQIVDAGNMVYTAKTFSSERYTLWNVRAAYHNLPLIGGQEQQPGQEYAARDAERLPDGLSLDLAPCYGKEAGVETLRREIRLTGGELTVNDDIFLSREASVTWVLMMRNRPAFAPGGFVSGAVRAAYSPALHAEAEEIPVTDARMARNFPGSLWRVTLTARPAKLHRERMIFRRNAPHA